jgi:hypothetical protein
VPLCTRGVGQRPGPSFDSGCVVWKIMLGNYVEVDFEARTLTRPEPLRGRSVKIKNLEKVYAVFAKMLEFQKTGHHQVGDACRRCIEGRLAARALMLVPCRGDAMSKANQQCDEEAMCMTCEARVAVIIDGKA